MQPRKSTCTKVTEFLVTAGRSTGAKLGIGAIPALFVKGFELFAESDPVNTLLLALAASVAAPVAKKLLQVGGEIKFETAKEEGKKAGKDLAEAGVTGGLAVATQFALNAAGAADPTGGLLVAGASVTAASVGRAGLSVFAGKAKSDVQEPLLPSEIVTEQPKSPKSSSNR